jgi:hypothetical protein
MVFPTKAALRKWNIRAIALLLPQLFHFTSKPGKQDENFPLYMLHCKAV